jgi:hypothetical protein
MVATKTRIAIAILPPQGSLTPRVCQRWVIGAGSLYERGADRDDASRPVDSRYNGIANAIEQRLHTESEGIEQRLHTEGDGSGY